jgi:hypothetical integral membrane protein (TIGR02206 family)
MIQCAPLILPVAATTFHTFGAQHLITLLIIAGLSVILFRLARKGTPAARRWLGRLLGVLLAGYAAVLYVQQAATHALSLQYSLPLDLCNLVLIACVLSLFRPNRFTSEIAYFWGFGGVLQATVTPDLASGFPSWDFLFFFWGHGVTLLAIVFLISDREFKPAKNSILRMMIALNAYAIVVGSINAIAGWNYGYLCQKPAMPSLLDWLGPWPWYILTLELIALITFVVLDRFWRLLAQLPDPDRV